jgi:hypothetical protein
MATSREDYYETYSRRPLSELVYEEDVLQTGHGEKAKKKRHKGGFGIIAILVTVILSVILLIVLGMMIWYVVLYYRVRGSVSPVLHGLNGTCFSDRDCFGHLYCSGGVCKLGPNIACTTSSQCEIGYGCVNNTCQGTKGAVCSCNTNCESPLVCTDNICSVDS